MDFIYGTTFKSPIKGGMPSTSSNGKDDLVVDSNLQLNGDLYEAGNVSIVGDLTVNEGNVRVSSDSALRFLNAENGNAISMYYTPSSAGGILQTGSPSSNAAITSLTNNYISMHSGTRVEFSVGDLSDPSMKLELTPTSAKLNGVDLLTGSGGGGGVTEEWVQGNFVPLKGDFTTSGAGTFSGTTTFSNEVNVLSRQAVRFRNGEGNTAVSLRFTDSPTGGVLNQGSASTTAAMTWMSGNYMSWFSSEFLRLYAGEIVNGMISPTAKIEANPSGVVLAAGAGDATKIVIDAGKIQVGGVALTLNVEPTAANHAATKRYVDEKIAGAGGGVTEDWVQANFVPLDGPFTTTGDGTFNGTTTFGGEVNILNRNVVRFHDDDGGTAVAIRFTDSPTGGVLNQGSASTTAAMTWMSGNYMSWFSSEFLRLYAGEIVNGMISPTAKIEANPSGVVLAAGAGDATKIVIDAGKIQVGGVALTLNVGPTAPNHAATKGYVDDKVAGVGLVVDRMAWEDYCALENKNPAVIYVCPDAPREIEEHNADEAAHPALVQTLTELVHSLMESVQLDDATATRILAELSELRAAASAAAEDATAVRTEMNTDFAKFEAETSTAETGAKHGKSLLASQNGEDGGFYVGANRSVRRSWTQYLTRYRQTGVRAYGETNGEYEDYLWAPRTAEDEPLRVARLKDFERIENPTLVVSTEGEKTEEPDENADVTAWVGTLGALKGLGEGDVSAIVPHSMSVWKRTEGTTVNATLDMRMKIMRWDEASGVWAMAAKSKETRRWSDFANGEEIKFTFTWDGEGIPANEKVIIGFVQMSDEDTAGTFTQASCAQTTTRSGAMTVAPGLSTHELAVQAYAPVMRLSAARVLTPVDIEALIADMGGGGRGSSAVASGYIDEKIAALEARVAALEGV